MRADQESTRRFHQRRSSAVETPTVLRLLASGFGFRPHRSLGCKGERSFNPPESPRFRVGGDPNKPQSCKYDNSTIVRFNHCSLDFDRVRANCAGGLRPMAERWPESKFLEDTIGHAIVASDEPDRKSHAGSHSRRRPGPFERFRFCRRNHRCIGQSCWHVQERSLRPFQV